MKFKIKIFFTVLISVLASVITAQTVAFPGAEGFGALASGGRGGSVYHVTSLNDSGPGTFRDAVSQPNRTIVFDISGVVKIKSRVNASNNLTIAGQTAPGEGIVIYGDAVSFSGKQNCIVRYIRFRGSINMSKGTCTLIADNARNLIFDHVSIEWGRWDNLHVKNSNNITFQYCLNGEAIDPQRFGALLENPDSLTIHHCLWIDNQSRNPKAKAGIQFINNIIYNWGSNGFVGGHSEADHYQDVINNYFIAGPNSSNSYIGQFAVTDHVYQKGNMVDLNRDGSLNGFAATDSAFRSEGLTLLETPTFSPKVPVTLQTAAQAFVTVLKEAGASLHRDAIDKRIIGYLNSLGKEGVIYKTEADAGGQVELVKGTQVKDTDGDGMPDEWEKTHKQNMNDPTDGSAYSDKTGYTNLEKYLNELVAK